MTSHMTNSRRISILKRPLNFYFLAFCCVIYQNLYCSKQLETTFHQFCEKPLHITFKGTCLFQRSSCFLQQALPVGSLQQQQQVLQMSYKPFHLDWTASCPMLSNPSLITDMCSNDIPHHSLTETAFEAHGQTRGWKQQYHTYRQLPETTLKHSVLQMQHRLNYTNYS